MMQRICPVCDQVMKHAHYCSACHSWVKDPVYMNVTYYLNERHPKNEAHCSYHNGEQEHTNAGAGKQKAMPWELGNPGKNTRKKTVPNQPKRNTARMPSNMEQSMKTERSAWTAEKGAAGQSKPVVKKTNPVKKLIILYIALMVVMWLFRLVSGAASSFLNITSSMFDSANGVDYRELTDEEARTYGGPCTDEAHFAVTMEDLQEPLQELIDTYPLPVTGTDTYSHNTVYSDETTWFSSTDTYYIEAEDAYAYVDFDYDTATGQLHQIFLSVPGRGSVTDMTKQFLLLLNDADAWDSEFNQRSDAADLDALYDRMMDSSISQTEGSWRGAGINAEFPDAEDENCNVWIYPDRNSDSYSYGENTDSL